MRRYFIVSRPGKALQVTRRDLEEFRAWLSRDLTYMRKRSKRFKLTHPTAQDANAKAIKVKAYLLSHMHKLLEGEP